MKNSLQKLNDYGQSVWLDYISRELISSGKLKRLIDEDGLKGVTSNPAIFEKSINAGAEYGAAIAGLSKKHHKNVLKIYEELAVKDIKDAADILYPVYENTNGSDGYVSLEVSPHLANDYDATVNEAKRLWAAVHRTNVMIKVPGTDAGAQAIKTLIADGINVNVTLLFSSEKYLQAAHSFIEGLEERAKNDLPLDHMASVASFFISRIDSKVDEWLTASNNPRLQECLGKTAIANAKLTYELFKDLYASKRWQALAQKGAQKQRLLWASTSTKNPNYSDVLYIEELIGQDTVNTVPPATLKAFREHGQLRNSLEENVANARQVMTTLKQEGISFEKATDELLAEAIVLFQQPFDKLLAAIEKQI